MNNIGTRGYARRSVEKRSIFAAMEKGDKNTAVDQNFHAEYYALIGSHISSVIINTEWEEKGDCFKKLSLYDSSYESIGVASNTTLSETV